MKKVIVMALGLEGFMNLQKLQGKSPNDPKLFLGIKNEEKLLSSLCEETTNDIVARFNKSSIEKTNITYKYQCKIQSKKGRPDSSTKPRKKQI